MAIDWGKNQEPNGVPRIGTLNATQFLGGPDNPTMRMDVGFNLFTEQLRTKPEEMTAAALYSMGRFVAADRMRDLEHTILDAESVESVQAAIIRALGLTQPSAELANGAAILAGTFLARRASDLEREIDSRTSDLHKTREALRRGRKA